MQTQRAIDDLAGHVVVESDPEERDRIDEDVLVVGVSAGIDDSNANIQIGVSTSQITPEARLVVRIGDEMYESTARQVGADSVVIPEVVSGTDVVKEL